MLLRSLWLWNSVGDFLVYPFSSLFQRTRLTLTNVAFMFLKLTTSRPKSRTWPTRRFVHTQVRDTLEKGFSLPWKRNAWETKMKVRVSSAKLNQTAEQRNGRGTIRCVRTHTYNWTPTWSRADDETWESTTTSNFVKDTIKSRMGFFVWGSLPVAL